MQLTTARLGPVQRTVTVFRLLMIALAGLAVALGPPPVDPAIVLLGAGYAAFTLLVWALAPRLDWGWLVAPIVIVDAAVPSAFIALLPIAASAWGLYLFAIVGAAAVGRLPATLAATVSITGYLAVSWMTTGAISAEAFWAAMLLAAIALMVATLAARWRAERRGRRAWQEIAAAGRAVAGGGEPDDVATLVVERARRLMRAERAGLWWYEGDRLRAGPQLGPAPDRPLIPASVSPGLVQRLGRGPVALAELSEPVTAVAGEAVMLRADKVRRIALLAVAWKGSPRDRAALRERLRVFAPWAADALARARDRADAREGLRREGVLRRAAGELAGTLDRQVVQTTVVEAARSGLGAVASLVERSSGHILVGDSEVAEALVRLTVDGEILAEGTDVARLPARQSGTPLVTPIGDRLALLAWRADPRLGESDAAWLGQLAALARAALERCAEYDRLQVERGRLEASLEALPAPCALWNAGGTLVLGNAAYRELGLDGVRPGGPPTGTREEEITVGDPPRTFVVVTSPFEDGQYVAAVYREITREREALRVKDELISMVGHELRTPLTSIRGYSQMMARQLGVVQKQVDQLNALIGDFMDASRLEGGKLPLAREKVDLAEAARAAAERFRGAHEGRGLRLELSDVPAVEGDPARLGQVLDNLLSNAAKYSPPEAEILLAVELDHDEVVVSVHDRGVGIAPEHLPHLFDRFFRVPGADTERVGGFGLGLSIARDLIAAHGGRIWAESGGEGQGSSFRFALPVASADGARVLRAVQAGSR
jgi:signal transduction histidine kinase